MTERRILTIGDPRLEERAEPVARIDDEVRALVADLFETLRPAKGIGLAAPQIGVSRRAIVVDPRPSGEEGTRELALINPEVVAYAGSCVFEEGCLSVPGAYADVRRPERVQVRYLGLDGVERSEEFEGLMARVVQHEIDHLEGVLFVYRLSPLRRAIVLRRLRGGASSASAARPLH